MNGLEKIKEHILEDARRTADEILSRANDEKDSILEEARLQARKQGESISKNSDAGISAYREKIDSSIDLERRTRILSAKQDLIGGIIENAKRKFRDLPETEYFDMLKKLLEGNIQSKDGKMFLSAKDLDRMPSGFEDDIRIIASARGAKLEISKEAMNIDGGFVLVYGGIEENCTIEALFEEKKDMISDIVQHRLFG